jgi:hypothetical protein
MTITAARRTGRMPVAGAGAELVSVAWSVTAAFERGGCGFGYSAPSRVEDHRTGRSMRIVDHLLWVRVGALAAVVAALMWKGWRR